MEHTDKSKKYFTTRLTGWHTTENDRSLPWKSEKDPYRIWLSEVILQQTRAQQGLPYYLKFVETFPTIRDLAVAKDEKVFRLWQGLGYYNRCKNMLATARYIVQELNGVFPTKYEAILELKGIGPYTAAAIASFAYGLPHAVVDGNVYRVLSRYFDIETPFDSTEGKKYFALLAEELLDKNDSAAYNQAIMDLGAGICKPQNPLCETCPIEKKCIANKNNLIDVLPVRSKRTAVRQRFFHYLILRWKDAIWMQKRTGKDIWENLYEPYLIESGSQLDTNEISGRAEFKKLALEYENIKFESASTQRLTHQVINARFFSVDVKKKDNMTGLPGTWLARKELGKTAFPKTVVSF